MVEEMYITTAKTKGRSEDLYEKSEDGKPLRVDRVFEGPLDETRIGAAYIYRQSRHVHTYSLVASLQRLSFSAVDPQVGEAGRDSLSRCTSGALHIQNSANMPITEYRRALTPIADPSKQNF